MRDLRRQAPPLFCQSDTPVGPLSQTVLDTLVLGLTSAAPAHKGQRGKIYRLHEPDVGLHSKGKVTGSVYDLHQVRFADDESRKLRVALRSAAGNPMTGTPLAEHLEQLEILSGPASCLALSNRAYRGHGVEEKDPSI